MIRKSKATEGLRVAQEITAIRAALHQRGYRLRKRPKQAAWTIYVRDDNFYQLTYQPAPISSWVLYPQNSDRDCLNCLNQAERHKIETIIQHALVKQSAGIARKVS